ncbi:Cathepsin L-like, partial [Geodia barretti]
MGALEGAWALAHGSLTELSEQNIIDCSVPYGNHGCQGGNMYNSFLYVVSNDGVDTADSYPFKGKQQSCSFSSNGL